MTQYYSRTDINYAGDSNFTIPFSYIDKNDIHVYVNDEEILTWIWLNDSQVQITSTLTTGDVISIRRITPIDEKIVTYQNMSMVLSDKNLNLSQDQVLDAVQEIYDYGLDSRAVADSAVTKAETAIATANSAETKADNAISTANTANSNASTALSTANTASSNASTAVNTANTAKNTADTAKETADATKERVDAFEETIGVVIDAAGQIEALSEAVETATSAATTASNKAQIASDKADIATAKAAEATAAVASVKQADWNENDTTSKAYIKNKPDLTTKQDTLVSGTNIKTVNNNSLLGSGNVDIDALPSQTGNAGKFLTTDGTNASWGSLNGKADIDLLNLSTSGENRLHALKGYLDNGTLLTDEQGFADVTTYAHTTFDVNKFTVVGSPTITSDGVASGFGRNKYLTTPQITFGNSVVVNFPKFRLNSYTFIDSNGGIVGCARGLQLKVNSSGKLNMQLSSNGTSVDIGTIASNDNTIALNTDYYAKLVFTGTTYTLLLSTDNKNFTTIGQLTSSSVIYSTILYIGVSDVSDTRYNILADGSIDLKYFSIAVDGVEVFNGNQTGVDTVKPNDWTVASGTATVSADGVATNSSGATYALQSTNAYNMSGVNHIVFTSPIFKYNATPSSNWFPTSCGDNSTGGFVMGLYSNGNLQMNYNNTGGTGSNTNVGISAGKYYQAKYEIIGTTVKFYYREVGNDWVLLKTAENITPPTSNVKINIASMSETNGNTSLDLNGCTLTFNGDLVYQACLKIPYTLSKTGSKVVDSFYRERVSDMYNQFGYAPYYTLSDTDFTLPQGELYGMYEKHRQQTLGDIFPDWSSTVEITSSFPYTCPSYGYLYLRSYNGYIEIDSSLNTSTYRVAGSSYASTTVVYPVQLNEILTKNSSSGSCNVYFIPMKGVN